MEAALVPFDYVRAVSSAGGAPVLVPPGSSLRRIIDYKLSIINNQVRRIAACSVHMILMARWAADDLYQDRSEVGRVP